MVDVGSLALVVAWVLAAYAVCMALIGAYRRKRDFIASAEHAALAVWGLALIAVAALLHALVIHDFSIEYVAHYSSTTLPLQYTIAALWGGQAGSLLFWLLILTSMSAVDGSVKSGAGEPTGGRLCPERSEGEAMRLRSPSRARSDARRRSS